MTTLSAQEVRQFDPSAFRAVLGQPVIHPGGSASTQRLVTWADVRPGERVLDIGCGVATTRVRLAREHGAQDVAADISPVMRDRAAANVAAAHLNQPVHVEDADILDLPYRAGLFDAVVAEAVTMFVDRSRAAAELARVTRPGGRVLATEVYWRRPPTPEARQMFLGEVPPGRRFDSIEAWAGIYSHAGLVDIRTESGPFEMLTARGFLADEGQHPADVLAREMSPPVYLRTLAWLMPRMARAVPYLGYVLVKGRKPADRASTEEAR